METLRRVFGGKQKSSQAPDDPELLISSPYNLKKPELDKTYPKVVGNQIEEPFKLSDIDSRSPFDEFTYLSQIGMWKSKPTI